MMENRLAYPAVFEKDGDGVYNVEFPDLPGCLTYGDTSEEAIENAQEAVSGWLSAQVTRSSTVPKPSDIHGDAVHYIEVPYSIAFVVWLRQKRNDRRWSQTEAAKRLGIRYQSYQRLEDPQRANPTLKTIARLQELFGAEILHV